MLFKMPGEKPFWGVIEIFYFALVGGGLAVDDTLTSGPLDTFLVYHNLIYLGLSASQQCPGASSDVLTAEACHAAHILRLTSYIRIYHRCSNRVPMC